MLEVDPAIQQSLLSSMEDLPAPPPPDLDEDDPPAMKPRRKARQNAVNDTGLRFDDSVPVKVIEVAPDLPDGVSLDDVDVIATRSTFRLAQRRASYEILEYRCPVIKVSAEAVPQATPAPATLFDGSLADVSFIAGMLVDKFCDHLPLYRQHQLEHVLKSQVRPWTRRRSRRVAKPRARCRRRGSGRCTATTTR
ncbi:MAG: hypothetical protein ACQEXG_16605 [Pseudomonadota bacterium]